jgi:hypothetical protein
METTIRKVLVPRFGDESILQVIEATNRESAGRRGAGVAFRGRWLRCQHAARHVTSFKAVAGLSHPSFRADEPERCIPSPVTVEVLGHVVEFRRRQ